MRNHPNRSRVAARQISTAAKKAHDHDHDYSGLLIAVQSSFYDATKRGALFTTDVQGLNDIYLDSLPSERQIHNCHACRHFIERFGGLVTIGDDGTTASAMWLPEEMHDFYAAAFEAMRKRIAKARVTGAFLSDLHLWGTPFTGEWSHMAIAPPADLIFSSRVLTPLQAMAAIRENYRTVAAALSEYKAPVLDEAIRILQADAVVRSERFIAPVRWLRELCDRPKGCRGENLLWLAVAMAPVGFCHTKASVIGTLLDDIAAGPSSFADIKARFDTKMHPLVYVRPQVAPSAGNVKAATDLVLKMGIAPSLERRFARLDEMETVWTPRVAIEVPADGIFSHLKTKDDNTPRHVELPSVTMTWEKFSRTALPAAHKIEVLVPLNRGHFTAFTTAVYFDAPPILKWDRDNARNPVAWYTYFNGCEPSQWGLHGGSWVPATAIVALPPIWGDRPIDYTGLVIILQGCIDSRDGGNALFPECLRQELHAVRSTIEAYSRSAQLSGREEASACGLSLNKIVARYMLRVHDGTAWNTYQIDRWD
jgi:hypothetical protein